MRQYIKKPLRWLRWLGNRFSHWNRYVYVIAKIRHEREQLGQLSDRELLDIGVDKIAAHNESVRELLDIPENRRGRVNECNQARADRLEKAIRQAAM